MIRWRVVPLAWLAVASFPRVAEAQESAEVRRAAREVALALANLIPAAEAARGRSGRYKANVFPVAEGAPAVVAIVDLVEFGWNAIGIHRRVEGVTCSVRVGAAGPLLGGPSEGWDPWCIGVDGAPVTPDLGAVDRQRVRWWHDPFLDSAPEQKDCPPLAVPRLPARNDTLYLSFLLDNRGRVAPAPVLVESTGSLVEASAAFSWLARCRFTPAVAKGRPVPSFVHLAYPLAPNHPLAPEAPLAWVSEDSNQTVLETWHAGVLARLLGTVATAQEAHRAETGQYAPSLAGLGTLRFTSDSSIWFAVAEATDSGFRAVAVRREPPDVVCSLLVINSPSPLRRTTCRGAQSGRDVTRPGDPAASPATMTSYREAVGSRAFESPPMREDCEPYRRLRNAPTEWDVVVEIVIDTAGRPEPRSLRILESSSLAGAAAAVRALRGCRYTPAMIEGHPVRVLVRQPIGSRPR